MSAYIPFIHCIQLMNVNALDAAQLRIPPIPQGYEAQIEALS